MISTFFSGFMAGATHEALSGIPNKHLQRALQPTDQKTQGTVSMELIKHHKHKHHHHKHHHHSHKPTGGVEVGVDLQLGGKTTPKVDAYVSGHINGSNGGSAQAAVRYSNDGTTRTTLSAKT